MAPRLNLVALGIAASVTLLVLFVLCWIVAAAMPGWVGASHGWIMLFTNAPVASVAALVHCVIFSVVFGWLIALILVPTYNKFVGK